MNVLVQVKNGLRCFDSNKNGLKIGLTSLDATEVDHDRFYRYSIEQASGYLFKGDTLGQTGQCDMRMEFGRGLLLGQGRN